MVVFDIFRMTPSNETDEERVEFQSADGETLIGLQRVSDEYEKNVILAHGITQDKHEFAGFYDKFTNYLSENDIGSFRFDFRAHGESSGKQKDLTFIGALLDLKAAFSRVKNSTKNDISLLGTSFGAVPSILYAYQNEVEIDNLVLLSPLLSCKETYFGDNRTVDLINQKNKEELENKGYITRPSGFEMGAKLIEEFRCIEPHDYLSDVSVPVLTAHGREDKIVDYTISERYGEPNAHSKYFPVDRVGHGFFAPQDTDGTDELTIKKQSKVMEKTVEWIND